MLTNPAICAMICMGYRLSPGTATRWRLLSQSFVGKVRFLLKKPFSIDCIGGGEIVYVHDVGSILDVLRHDHPTDRACKGSFEKQRRSRP